MAKRYVYLSDNEVYLIAQTPENECKLCDKILRHITHLNGRINRISIDWLKKNGLDEHLRQIVGHL